MQTNRCLLDRLVSDQQKREMEKRTVRTRRSHPPDTIGDSLGNNVAFDGRGGAGSVECPLQRS